MNIFGRFFGTFALFAGIASCLSDAAWGAGFTIDFDHLPTLGATDGNQSIADANGGSNTIQGVTFAANFRVAGDQYRIGGAPPNPSFGVPHSGHYFLNNGNTPNDDLVISAASVLTEAWFGRNEYYGYGGGASAVTVTALRGSLDLGSITLDLPDTFPYTGNLPPPNDSIGNGLPDPMVRMDTSSFLGLVGISDPNWTTLNSHQGSDTRTAAMTRRCAAWRADNWSWNRGTRPRIGASCGGWRG